MRLSLPASIGTGVQQDLTSRNGAPMLFEALSYRGDAFQY
ncbi:hypothetical protein BCAR13_240002 [Paraburkholderia caribensis]|nr:hypothetical protein BCAR13_240002 [Paraburkholderia caribensis]